MKKLLLLLALGGCSGATDPNEWRRVVGLVDPSLSSIQAVKFPASVAANQSFTVTVTTVGSSSCTRESGGTVDLKEADATVTPYDLIAPEFSICTADLHAFPRDFQVRYTRVGSALLRVKTRTSDGRTAELTYQIDVR
jgi:hypothetical protein